jgi:hypothetical protein
VAQGVGSNITLTLLDAIEKHNQRNPGREVLLLNWAGQDEEMTNEHCSFWQVRTDAHTGMKIAALVVWLARDAGIRRVYLINQDYSTGQTARRLLREYLGRLRPDIAVVGDDLVPPYRVQDWNPYVSRIQASGDLGLLLVATVLFLPDGVLGFLLEEARRLAAGGSAAGLARFLGRYVLAAAALALLVAGLETAAAWREGLPGLPLAGFRLDPGVAATWLGLGAAAAVVGAWLRWGAEAATLPRRAAVEGGRLGRVARRRALTSARPRTEAPAGQGGAPEA